jgi:nitrite reductase/ring-hydroxylating ferredoxin subunit
MNGRREFIKNSCSLCLALAGSGSLAVLASACVSLPVYETTVMNNMISIPVTDIPTDDKYKIIRAASMSYDIMLVRKQDEGFIALLMKCTHVGNPLVAGKSGLVCNFHGSTFDLHGQVTHGPATEPLKKFKVRCEDDRIKIFLG